MENLFSEPKKVKRVFKDEPSKDGFSAILETEEVVSISDTQWKSLGFIEEVEDGVVFKSPKGKIHFTQTMKDKVELL